MTETADQKLYFKFNFGYWTVMFLRSSIHYPPWRWRQAFYRHRWYSGVTFRYRRYAFTVADFRDWPSV